MYGRHKRALYTPGSAFYILYISSFCFSFQTKIFQHIKEYLVCEKVGCWFTNYIQQKCADLKKKFGNCYSKYKAQLDYEQNLQYWITKYKDIDNNKYITHYFRDLSINIYNDYILELIIKSFYTELEKFYTFFSQLKSFKSITVVNTLANNAFKH